MPRGIPGSGPFAKVGAKKTGQKRGRKSANATATTTGQSASNGADMNADGAVAVTGKGRGRGRSTSGATPAKRGQSASNGQQRGEGQQPSQQPGGGSGGIEQQVVGGIKIETVPVPGRGGRPQQAEEFPFGSLEPVIEQGGEMVGPSFVIPEAKNPDQVLAAARKRHKGKTFMSRKTEGGVRIWRKA